MSSAVNNLGTFNPNQYKNNGTGEKPSQRMAGDYLSEFTNKMESDKKETMRPQSYQGKQSHGTHTNKLSFGNGNRPTKANANKSNSQSQASTPVTSSGSQGSVNNNNTAVLPKDMQQDMIDRGGTINADGSYEVGSAFESRWEKRHSPENLAAQKKAQEDLFAHAGVSSREEYFASDRHKASRSRAQSDTQRLKEKQARLGYS